MGRLGSLRPARARRTARAMVRMASSWPTTFSCRASSILRSLCDSSEAMRVTGMPVHMETTSQMSSAVTTGFSCWRSLRQPASRALMRSWSFTSRSRSSAAYSYCCWAMACSFSRRMLSSPFMASWREGGA